MASLVQSVIYGAVNTYYTTINGLYDIPFLSEAYTLQNNTTIDGKVISAGKWVVKSQYLCYVQVNTNWYWKQQHYNILSWFQHAQYFIHVFMLSQ